MTKISSGSADIDRWLLGGYETDVVSVIYGGSGSGKTNFCLLAAVSQARKGKKVAYIDTEGGFSVERIKQLAGEDYEKVLGNIFVLKPTNFREQQQAFAELEKYLREQISLIIVDSFTILYRIDFAEAREQEGREMQKVNSELARQIKTLAVISRKKNIPVIITNQVYNWEEKSKMVGGDILQYWGKCWIELINENGRRSAFLRKHRSLPEKSLGFQIYNEGIRKRGWI